MLLQFFGVNNLYIQYFSANIRKKIEREQEQEKRGEKRKKTGLFVCCNDGIY